MPAHKPHWRLPPGVTRGLWEYAHSDHIAEDYDNYFSFNKLFTFDEQIAAKYFELSDSASAPIVADLGCGTGRALVPLVRRGFRGLAVDLSERMLNVVREKADSQSLDIECVRANLVDLEGIRDDSIDYAICLFSTLGMIRGRDNRQAALRNIRRILKPDGVFVLHVHNYWYNLYDPGGPWWFLKNFVQSKFDRDVDQGDKFFNYRGVHNMFLHVFSPSELRRSLRRAGFRIQEFVGLDPARLRELKNPWFFSRFRANGWIVVCT
jgi:ubiquinone/menaquinone biosynthesis C-methylase UbiE